MKKLSGFLVLAALAAFLMTSCVDDETSAVDITGTATIKGRVFLDNDVTVDGNETAEGAKVRVRYNAADLSVASDGDSRWVTVETTTDADGKYSIDVPASPNELSYNLTVDQLETTFKYEPTDSTTQTVEAVFSNASRSLYNVSVGEIRVEDFTLTAKYIYF